MAYASSWATRAHRSRCLPQAPAATRRGEMTTPDAQRLDDWIRGRFRELNTALEELYCARERGQGIDDVGRTEKVALCREGQQLIADAESHANGGLDGDYALLGNVGFYMAACARHQIDEAIAGPAARQREAMALAMRLGARLGVAPRFRHVGTNGQRHHQPSG